MAVHCVQWTHCDLGTACVALALAVCLPHGTLRHRSVFLHLGAELGQHAVRGDARVDGRLLLGHERVDEPVADAKVWMVHEGL